MSSGDRVAYHQARFIDMLDASFRHYGAVDGLPERLREAVAATPRHQFVHRFRIDGPLQDHDADPEAHLATIYSDEVMRHVDAAGEALPSTNSQPSYVLWLLHLLGLEQGQAVLEIGSGSGWLAAIMARLVGPAGRVTGIELIAGLAEQSRKDLAGFQLDNVTIMTGDGTRGHQAGAPYDRAMITAATWDVPSALFDQLRDGGKILIPIELRGGDGCQVTWLRRRGRVLAAERSTFGKFVPLLGAGQSRAVCSPDALSFWHTIAERPVIRYDLPLGAKPGGASEVAGAFRAFLGRTEAGLLIDDGKPAPFGLTDAAAQSVALWEGGVVTGYGNPTAATRLADAYRRWAKAGLPGMAAFDLQIHRAGEAPAPIDQQWVEQRGDAALVWRIRAGSAAQAWTVGCA